MTNIIDSFLKSVKDHVAATRSEAKPLSADYVESMATLGAVVDTWIADNNLGECRRVGSLEVLAPAKQMTTEVLAQAIGPERIVDLCKAAHVAEEHLEAACTRVASLLAKSCGCASRDVFLQYNARSNTDQKLTSIETLYPATVNLAGTASLEQFGINMDRVEPDLKAILTIALLQFHTNLTPRVVPVQTTAQGNVTIVRESMELFDLSETNGKPVRVIELYRDPSMVSVMAQRIKPLKTRNDAAGKFLLADDVYLFEKKICMFDMALDDRPGFEKYNHTDFVEDNIVLDGVLLKVSYKNGDAAAIDFYRMIPIPASRGRLTQFSNDLRSTDRRLALDRFPVRIIKGDDADTLAGLTSNPAALAELENGVGLALDLHVNCHVDRRTSFLDASCWNGGLAIKGGNLTDDARAALLAKFSVEVMGFTLDARYNEDNKRKCSVRAEMFRRSMSYELPAGRNFVIDSAIGQDGVLNAAARLAQLEHIGRDFNTLQAIEEVMKSVHDQNVSMNNDADVQASLAAQYAAGDLVNQFVYIDQFDMTGMYGVRSADASGDTKQMVKTYFNRLTSELLLKTFFAQQLAEGAQVTFRVITAPNLLGELFMAKHIHAHLESDQAGQGGVEYAITLDNGVRLEFVTTTFDLMKDKVILIPYLQNSANSVLNFGQNFDQGTLVGAMSVASDQSCCYHRMFSTTRQITIPTNVMGAIITVTGYSAITMTDTTSALTVAGF